MTRIGLGFLFCVVVEEEPVQACGQEPEIIWVDGEKYELPAYPLEDYFHLIGKRPRALILGGVISTGCARQYRATWSIEEGCLWLRSVERQYWTTACESEFPGTEWRQIPCDSVFPEQQYPVVASWFTGVLPIPRGECTYTYHLHEYERFLAARVEHGVVLWYEEKPWDSLSMYRKDIWSWPHPTDDYGTSNRCDSVSWIDARFIGTEFTDELERLGETFRTRGWLSLESDSSSGVVASLSIPPTREEEGLSFDVRDLSASLAALLSSNIRCVPVEIEARLVRDEIGDLQLTVVGGRLLSDGVLIHHRAFMFNRNRPPDAGRQ